MGTWRYEIQGSGERISKEMWMNKVMEVHYNAAETAGRVIRTQDLVSPFSVEQEEWTGEWKRSRREESNS